MSVDANASCREIPLRLVRAGDDVPRPESVSRARSGGGIELLAVGRASDPPPREVVRGHHARFLASRHLRRNGPGQRAAEPRVVVRGVARARTKVDHRDDRPSPGRPRDSPLVRPCHEDRGDARDDDERPDRATPFPRARRPLRACEERQHLVHRRRPLLTRHTEPPQERPPDGCRHARPARCFTNAPRSRARNQLDERRPFEGAGAVEALVESHRERKDVRAGVRDPSAELFRRHVRGGPHDGPRLRQLVGRRRVEQGTGRHHHRPVPPIDLRAGESEVGDSNAPVLGDEDVVRLEVAMNEPCVVGCRETRSRARIGGQDLADAPRPLGEPPPERPPPDELHRDEQLVSERADVVDGDDVGMGEACHRPRLAEETLAKLLSRGAERRIGLQDLERDESVEVRVIRFVHRAHRTRADAATDVVTLDAHAGLETRVFARKAWCGRRSAPRGRPARREERLRKPHLGRARTPRTPGKVGLDRHALGPGEPPLPERDESTLGRTPLRPSGAGRGGAHGGVRHDSKRTSTTLCRNA